MVATSALLGGGKGVKTIQTGFLDSVGGSTGTGEYLRYYDVTLGTAVVVANCVAFFQGGASDTGDRGILKAGSTAASEVTAVVTGVNTLKLGSPDSTYDTFTGRWYVIEYDA